LSFGYFRRADNYLFHVDGARHATKINWGRTSILLDIRANCKARLVIRVAGSTLQTGELNTAKGYLHAFVGAIVGAEFFGVKASLLPQNHQRR
jgi:hypothetical protein